MDYITYIHELFSYVLKKTEKYSSVEEIKDRVNELNLEWLVRDLFEKHEYFAIDGDVLLVEIQ